LLTRDPINQIFWDNNNHLYAISQSSGKLLLKNSFQGVSTTKFVS